MGSWELLGVELVLVVVLALLSLCEGALHAIRRPALVEELVTRGRRGQRAGRMGERRVRYLATIQVVEFFVIFAFSGIAAAFIAPRLSELLRLIDALDEQADPMEAQPFVDRVRGAACASRRWLVRARPSATRG